MCGLRHTTTAYTAQRVATLVLKFCVSFPNKHSLFYFQVIFKILSFFIFLGPITLLLLLLLLLLLHPGSVLNTATRIHAG